MEPFWKWRITVPQARLHGHSPAKAPVHRPGSPLVKIDQLGGRNKSDMKIVCLWWHWGFEHWCIDYWFSGLQGLESLNELRLGLRLASRFRAPRKPRLCPCTRTCLPLKPYLHIASFTFYVKLSAPVVLLHNRQVIILFFDIWSQLWRFQPSILSHQQSSEFSKKPWSFPRTPTPPFTPHPSKPTFSNGISLSVVRLQLRMLTVPTMAESYYPSNIHSAHRPSVS